MAKQPTDTTGTSSGLPAFDLQITAALRDESNFREMIHSAEVPPKDGRIKTVWRCAGGTFIIHRHSWATGMAYLNAKRNYSVRFEEALPSWVLPLPPIVIVRLCGIALSGDRPLPTTAPQLGVSASAYSLIMDATEAGVRCEAG